MPGYRFKCPTCGRAFTARRIDAVTYSNNCKVKRWRHAERDELEALRQRLAELENK